MSAVPQSNVRSPASRFAPVLIMLFLCGILVLQPLIFLGSVFLIVFLALAAVRPEWVLWAMICTFPLQGVLVFSYGANIKISELLGCALIAGVLIRRLIWREPLVVEWRITLPLLAFLGVVLLSTLNTQRLRPEMVLSDAMETGLSRTSPDARSYLTAAWSVYCALLLASVSSVLRTVERVHRAVRLLVWSAAGSAAFGIFQWIYLWLTGNLFELPGSTYHADVVHWSVLRFPRTPSSFTEPSVFANFLTLTIPVTLVLLLLPQARLLGRRMTGLIVLAQLVALLLSFSASGYVVFFIVVAFLGYLLASMTPLRRFASATRVGFAALLAGLVMLALGQFVGIYPADVTEFVAERLTGRADSAQARFALSKVGWEMAMDHYLTGVGIGNYPFLVLPYAARHSVFLSEFILPTPSNLFVLFLAELGVVGTSVFLLFLLKVKAFFSRSLRALPPGDLRFYQAALCSSMVGILVSFLFLDNLFVYYFWVMLGLAVAIDRVSRNRSQRTPEAEDAAA